MDYGLQLIEQKGAKIAKIPRSFPADRNGNCYHFGPAYAKATARHGRMTR